MGPTSWLVFLGVALGAAERPETSGTRAVEAAAAQIDQGEPGDYARRMDDTARRLGVAWTDSTNGSGLVRAMSVLSPWEFATPMLESGPESILRSAEGRVYVVSRTEGTIAVINPDTWTTLHVHSLGVGSEPADIAVVSSELAYVTRRTATHLARLNLLTGDLNDVVDLSPFADADGVPDMNMMAVHEGRLFVQIRRVDLINMQFVPPAYLAVVDLESEQLIDVDPGTAGVQAIELQGMAPKFKMQVMPQTRRLFVSASGDMFDEGGLEMIDLDTLQSAGLVLREAEDGLGADLGSFVMVAPDRGYFVATTDFALSSHLQSFSISGGVELGPELFVTLDYFIPTLAFDSQTNTVFFPVGGTSGQGVHVLDALTDTLLTQEPIPTSGPPSDIALVHDDVGPVPAVSQWGLMLVTLLTLTSGTVILMRHRREGS